MAVVGHQEGLNTTAASPSPKSRADIFAPSAYASSPLRSDSSIDKVYILILIICTSFPPLPFNQFLLRHSPSISVNNNFIDFIFHMKISVPKQ